MTPRQGLIAALRTLPLLLAIAVNAALVGCEGKNQPATTSSHFSMSFDGLTGGLDAQVNGVEVDIDETIKYVSETNRATGQETKTEVTVDGMPFLVLEGRFTIGDHSFDGIVKGDRIHLSTSGISVNDERRWDWPGE